MEREREREVSDYAASSKVCLLDIEMCISERIKCNGRVQIPYTSAPEYNSRRASN